MALRCSDRCGFRCGLLFSGDTEATNKCATNIYPSYNPKVLEQCMDVCIKCDRGVTTTCATSCNLKGAR